MDLNQSWDVSPAEAIQIQKALAGRLLLSGEIREVRLVAGVDVSIDRLNGRGIAAAVVLDYPGLSLIEAKVAEGRVSFPYIPGLLSFREVPLVLEAWRRLSVVPDLVLADGQGLAHPRRIGFASHLGLLLDKPTIGCAKSRLCGQHEEPEKESGSLRELRDDGEVIGAVVRTRSGVKPVYVSIGHRIDLPSSIAWVLRCTRGYRLPEPIRVAHRTAGQAVAALT